MRRLIVNADDFGASSGTNGGIVECHSRGSADEHQPDGHGRRR